MAQVNAEGDEAKAINVVLEQGGSRAVNAEDDEAKAMNVVLEMAQVNAEDDEAKAMAVLLEGSSRAVNAEDDEAKAMDVVLEQGSSRAVIIDSPPMSSIQVVDQNQDQNQNSHHPIPIPETPPAAATGAVEDQEKQREEALKVALGFIAISAPGIITIGMAANQISEGHRVGLKICAILLAASFLLSSCLFGLASFPGRIPNWSKIVKTFKWMTLGVLILAILGLGLYFVF